jgi:thiamine biosynthesis protein ThiS
MRITLNGRTFDFDDPHTVESLIIKLELSGKLAVEINKKIIPRSQFPSHVIQPDDSVEIVHAIGGG